MVRFSAQEEDVDRGGRGKEGQEVGESLELQEARLGQLYTKGLQLIQQGRLSDACDIFKSALADPALNRDVTRDPRFSDLKHVKYLCVKNLALVTDQLGDKASSLVWLGEAVALDGSDVVMWKRLGETALRQGKLNISRCALERGLLLRPNHILCLEMLAEVNYSIGDMDACIDSADRLMALTRPPNPKAKLLKGMAMRHNPRTAYEGEELLQDARDEGGSAGGIEERIESVRRIKRPRLCEADKGIEEVMVERASWVCLITAGIKAVDMGRMSVASRPERGTNVPVLVRVIEDAREGGEGEGADDGGADEGKKEGEGNKAPLKDEEALCVLCGGDDEEEDILLLCDDFGTCGYAIHRSCHSPPLPKIPEGSWYCPKCDQIAKAAMEVDGNAEGGSGGASQVGKEAGAGRTPKNSSRRKSGALDKTPKDGERRSARAQNSRPPLAESLSGILAAMTDVEAGVRREAEAGNSFGRVASEEALALAAAASQGKGDGEEQDEPREPMDPGVDLSRYQMALRVPPLSTDAEATEVQAFVNDLPSPCGVMHFAASVLRSAADRAGQTRFRGTCLQKLLQLDDLLSLAVGDGALSPDQAMTLAELRFDQQLEVAAAKEREVEEQEGVSGGVDGGNSSSSPLDKVNDDGAKAKEAAAAWMARLVAPLRASGFGGSDGAARLGWLTGRLVIFDKGPLVTAIAAFQFCQDMLGEEQGGIEIVLPSCVRGNRINIAAVKRKLKSPHEQLERADNESAIDALDKALKEREPGSDEGKMLAEQYHAALRSALIPEVAAEGRFLVTSLCGYGEKNKAGRDDKEEKLARLHMEGIKAGTEAGLREAFYTLNLLLAEVVGLESPVGPVSEKEEAIIFSSLDVDGVKRAQSAMCLLRNLIEMPLLSGGLAIKPGEWESLKNPFGHMVDQLQVQLLRLVCRLGSSSKVQGAMATFTAACSLMYAIRTRMCPMERAARMELMSPILDEVIKRGGHFHEGCCLLRTYLAMLNEDKSEKDEVMSQPVKIPSPGGDSDDSDEDDDEVDHTDREIAKCYYLILDIKIRGFEIVYDEVDRLTGRDQAGVKVSKISLTAREKQLALDLFDFIRPRVLRAITKGYSSSFKEPLQAILEVFPEPPAELATSKAAICAYLTDIFVQNQGAERPLEDLKIFSEWFKAERLPPSGSDGDGPFEDDDSDVVMLPSTNEVIDLDSQTDNGDAKDGANSKKAMSDRQRELRLFREIYLMMGSSLLSVGRDAGSDKAYQMFATDLWIHPRRARSWEGLASASQSMLFTSPSAGIRLVASLDSCRESRVLLFRTARALFALGAVATDQLEGKQKEGAVGAEGGGDKACKEKAEMLLIAREGLGLMCYLLMQGSKRLTEALNRLPGSGGYTELLNKVGTLCIGELLKIDEQDRDWRIHYILGRTMSKLHHSVQDVMKHLWFAFELNSEGGNVVFEAFYTLQSARARYALLNEGIDCLGEYSLHKCIDARDEEGKPLVDLPASALEEARKEQAAWEEESKGIECQGIDSVDVLRDCMVALRCVMITSKGKCGARMRVRLASLMSRSAQDEIGCAQSLVSVLKPLFLTDQDRVGTAVDNNFAFSSRLKEVETVPSWTLKKRVRLKIKAGVLLASSLLKCPSKESLDRCDQLYQTILRFEKQVARLNNKRGASSIIEALHASLSSLVTLMHMRIASDAAAEEDIFQRAGRIRQDLVKHEKDGIWEGLELPFSPGNLRPKSKVTLADDPDSCPISNVLVSACQAHAKAKASQGNTNMAEMASSRSAAAAARMWDETFSTNKRSRLSLASRPAAAPSSSQTSSILPPGSPQKQPMGSPSRGGAFRGSPARTSSRAQKPNEAPSPSRPGPQQQQQQQQQQDTLFEITVPPNVKAGDVIEVLIPVRNTMRRVVLPDGYLPGSKLRLSVDDDSPFSSAAPVPAGETGAGETGAGETGAGATGAGATGAGATGAGATGAGETGASSGAGQPSAAAGAAVGGSKVIDLSGD